LQAFQVDTEIGNEIAREVSQRMQEIDKEVN
jgi:hypothetical protein